MILGLANRKKEEKQKIEKEKGPFGQEEKQEKVRRKEERNLESEKKRVKRAF